MAGCYGVFCGRNGHPLQRSTQRICRPSCSRYYSVHAWHRAFSDASAVGLGAVFWLQEARLNLLTLVLNRFRSRFPEFAEAHPLEVTLEPGDVLFVPNHWWHFVEAVETSLSVNVWLEAPGDAGDRCSESVARVLVTSLADGLAAEASDRPRAFSLGRRG